MLESLGPLLTGPVLDAALVDARQVWEVELPAQCDAADTTVRAARRFGITAEIGTLTPYDEPRRWARAFAAAGLGGIRYRARHDPGGGRCLALFGAAGERRRWRRGRAQSVRDAGLVERLLRDVGVRVEDEEPPSSDLVDVSD